MLLTMIACLIREDVYTERKALLADEDADGWSVLAGDCADSDPAVHPDADEQCNGADDDCDLAVDEGVDLTVWYADVDGDGFGAGTGVSACSAPIDHVSNGDDCGPDDPNIGPGFAEVPYDGIDQDCDDADLDDVDGDGEAGAEAGGPDCDDADATRTSTASETWEDDGIDNDCDGDPLDAVAWDPSTATTRFEGPSAGAELGRGVSAWEDCLLLDAPYVEESRGAVFAERGAGTRVVGSGGWVEGSAPYAYLSVKDVGAELVVLAEPVQDAGAVWMVPVEELCAGPITLPANGQAIAGSATSDFFGSDATWVGDVDGDGLDDLAVVASGAFGGEGSVAFFPGDSLSSVTHADDFEWLVRGGEPGVALSEVARANGRDGSWLVIAGSPTSDNDAAIRRVPIDDLAVAAVDDIADGWVTGIRSLRPYVVGDVGVDGGDDIVLAGGASTLWDVTAIAGSVSEGDALVYLRAEGEEWLTTFTALGDIDGGGRADILLQADDYPMGAARGRVAFLFGEDIRNGSDNYFETQRLTAAGSSAGDAFGYSAAATGDFDGDSTPDVAIAAYSADTNGSASGSVYLLPLP